MDSIGWQGTSGSKSRVLNLKLAAYEQFNT